MDPSPLKSQNEDKIRKERERIRIASAKTREKKRQEEVQLRVENETLKKERLTLTATLKELEETIERFQNEIIINKDELSEKELLEKELKQYKDFASCILLLKAQEEDIVVKFVKEKCMYNKLMKAAIEMAEVQLERIMMCDSIQHSTKWISLKIESSLPTLPSSLQACYNITQDGSLELRILISFDNFVAKDLSRKFLDNWCNPKPVLKLFQGSGDSYWFGDPFTSIDFPVEELASSSSNDSNKNTARLLRVRNVSNNRSWVFLMTNAENVPYAKSTFLPPAIGGDGSEDSSSSQHGIVSCFTGLRSSVMVDATLDSSETLQGRFLEGFRAWNEKTEKGGVRTRAVLMLVSSADFLQRTFGQNGVSALIDFNNGSFTPTYQRVIDFIALSCGLGF